MKVAFMGDEREIERVFSQGRRSRIEERAEVLPGVLSANDDFASEVEAIFSTWGMPLLSEAQLDRMHRLRAVFYAAGAVGYFAPPLVRRRIHISSAWYANAIPVAEFALSQILLSCKQYFANAREYGGQEAPMSSLARGPGVYGETVALLGAGAVGTKLIELLRHFCLKTIVFDPFLTEQRAAELDVRKVSLEAAFGEAYVVSNHLLDVPETQGLIDLKLLKSMRQGATLLNTGRGRTLITNDLIQVLHDRSDLTALLDVTDPEPLPSNHPLLSLPNCIVSAHIAGSIGDEVIRLADYAIEEFDRFRHGKPLLCEVFV
jgi:phosphoglycerate dehydrogenase-like enzyme